MYEAIAFWMALSSWQIGLVLLPFGLILGSFGTVVWHRLPRGESLVWPGSHCPSCHCHLGPADLVPVLSYLLRRGRCRSCGIAIPVRYPLVEGAFGLAAGVGGWLGGWTVGLALVGALVLGCCALALWRRKGFAAQAGFTLVEVAVAALCLTVGLAGTFEAVRVARWAGYAAQRRTQAIAMARFYVAKASYDVMNPGFNPVPTGIQATVTDTNGDYTITTRYMVHPLVDNLWGVDVTVTCTATCQGTKSPSGIEAHLLGVVRR